MKGFEPPFPSFRQYRRRIVDRVGVVAKTVMKRGILSNRIQPFRPVDVPLRDQTNFDGANDLIGEVRKFSMQRLASNDHKLRFTGDATCGPQDVINLLLLH